MILEFLKERSYSIIGILILLISTRLILRVDIYINGSWHLISIVHFAMIIAAFYFILGSVAWRLERRNSPLEIRLKLVHLVITTVVIGAIIGVLYSKGFIHGNDKSNSILMKESLSEISTTGIKVLLIVLSIAQILFVHGVIRALKTNGVKTESNETMK
ncbi:MAG: amino acid transporter [Crocinitomicaceae bacterium]|jgi:amino acid transporter